MDLLLSAFVCTFAVHRRPFPAQTVTYPSYATESKGTPQAPLDCKAEPLMHVSFRPKNRLPDAARSQPPTPLNALRTSRFVNCTIVHLRLPQAVSSMCLI